MNEADKKYYDRLMRIMFREQLCSLHAAACWLSAGKYCFTGNRKKPFQGHTDQPSVTPK